MSHTKIKKVTGFILTRLKKLNSEKVVKKKDKTKVIVGPSESMSKSKKNTIDPETMIESIWC